MSDEPNASEFSLRILWSVARWIEDNHGSDALARVAERGGVSPTDFDGSTRWVSHAQIEHILEAARELAGDEATMCAAFSHRFEESFGAFRHMVWALSVERQSHLAIAMSNKVLTHVSRFETLSSTRTTFAFRYTSEKPESRLMCLSRQMAWVNATTLRGLPKADLAEKACIANGDACCEYHVRWLGEDSITPVLIGLAVGIAAAVVLWAIHPSISSTVLLPMFGGAIGRLADRRRVAALNVRYVDDVGDTLRTLGRTEAETRFEILALQERQQAWSRRMEVEANERTGTLERVVEGLEGLQQSRVSSLRGFSHDLRNPLFALRGNTQLLSERIRDGENGEILRDMDEAAQQIETMLGQLMELATTETGRVSLAPRPLKVAPLVDGLKRRLKALVHGRNIDVNVVCEPDAPSSVLVDPTVFDRVVDNLLTNAAKYTDRGSIRLVLGAARADGTESSRESAGALELRLSDTGRGIPAAKLSDIFRPRAPGEPRSKDSYGIGLSSVVRLLDQIGGRLEVTSEVAVGSTFVARFPAAPPDVSRVTRLRDPSFDEVIEHVVQVRARTAA